MIFSRIKTQFNIIQNQNKKTRKLEIGASENVIPGFETLNILPGKHIDYVWDASKQLPFRKNSFDTIYASHVLEHIPWYQTETVLKEWVRIIKPSGALEIWIPDGLKICQAFIDAELNNNNYIEQDGWYRFNQERDPCKWASGRLFTYGDGTGNLNHPNWHRAIFTPRFLRLLLAKSGLKNIRTMDSSEVRGVDHKWINLGMCGIKT